jgi:hypothetical protein
MTFPLGQEILATTERDPECPKAGGDVLGIL